MRSLLASFLLFGLSFSGSAAAIDYRSVVADKAVLFDAPSTAAVKRFIVNQGYPLEVLVELKTWVKVRDQFGDLSWIEAAQLGSKRTVLVKADSVKLYKEADTQSPQLATVKKGVVLEVSTSTVAGGWVKVKHRDGVSGFVAATALWGI